MLKPVKPNSHIISISYMFHDFVKITSALPGLLWFRPKLLYENDDAREHIKGGAILIVNHVSLFDPVYIQIGIWYRRHHFICLKDFFESWAAPLFKGFLCIPINKNDFSINSLRDMTEYLKCGELVTMFPEGHINLEDEKDSNYKFKTGMALLSMISKCPIVPMYIKKRNNIFERMIMTIGSPVDVISLYGNHPTMLQLDQLVVSLQDKEQDLKEIASKYYSEKHANRRLI